MSEPRPDKAEIRRLVAIALGSNDMDEVRDAMRKLHWDPLP